MSFLLDASIVSCWDLEDEGDPRADFAFARLRTDQALVPGLWWLEVRNILVVNDRKTPLLSALISIEIH
ncbi:MAG: hypothetical protein ACLQU1_06750 [Bryobacteraceae bacterium]